MNRETRLSDTLRNPFTLVNEGRPFGYAPRLLLVASGCAMETLNIHALVAKHYDIEVVVKCGTKVNVKPWENVRGVRIVYFDINDTARKWRYAKNYQEQYAVLCEVLSSLSVSPISQSARLLVQSSPAQSSPVHQSSPVSPVCPFRVSQPVGVVGR